MRQAAIFSSAAASISPVSQINQTQIQKCLFGMSVTIGELASTSSTDVVGAPIEKEHGS